MAIEINGVNGPRIQGTEAGQVSSAQQSGQQQTQPTADATRADSVNLTEAGRQLARLEGEIRDLPVVDAQRVEAVRESVNDGTYTVDNRAVAHKLTQFEAYIPNR